MELLLPGEEFALADGGFAQGYHHVQAVVAHSRVKVELRPQLPLQQHLGQILMPDLLIEHAIALVFLSVG